MFSQEERCIYTNNQLMEVICQLRFPTILAVGAREPVDFQDAVRGIFPRYQQRQDQLPPKVTQMPGQAPRVEPQKPVTNHQFMTADGHYRINLTQDFISLTASPYTCWEVFARMMDKPLASFIKLYQPAYFERVGLRYLNFLSRASLGTDAPWRDLVSACYLGPMAEEDVGANAFSQCNLDTELAIRAGCRVKIHAGTGFVKKADKQDPEQKFIFDMDLFMPGKVPVNYSAGALATLHSQAFPIFRDAITELTHNAMEPKDL